MAAVGYRFHPTDEELITHYLKLKMNGHDALVNKVIGEVDVYRLEPSDLPRRSLICSSEDQVWYFFCRLDYKYKNSKRASRATERGFWKITGQPRFILARDSGSQIGVKKTLVFFYRTRGDVKPIKTDWVIHEYQATETLPDQKEYVICKLKHKGDDWTKSTVSVNGGTSHVTPVSDVENHAAAVQVQESSAPAIHSPVCLEEGISIDDFLEDNVLSLMMEGANNGPSNFGFESNEDVELWIPANNGLSNFGFESDEEVDPNSFLTTPDDYCATETMYARPNDYTPGKSLSTYHPEDGIPQVNVITAGTPETYLAFSEDKDEASSPFIRQSMAQFSMASLRKAKQAEEATKQLTRAAAEAVMKERLLRETPRAKKSLRITNAQHSALELSPAASSSKVCKRSVSCIQMVEILTGHEQSPPTVYIWNILVALLVLFFFICDLPFLR